MISKSLRYSVLLQFLIAYSCTTLPTTSTNQSRFRSDYFYMSQTDSYYNIHLTPATWFEAKQKCVLETASLFYPEDEPEANLITDYWKRMQPNLIADVHIGVSDLIVEGVYETIDGRPLSTVYNKWYPNEPNNIGDEDCVTIGVHGLLNDVPCQSLRGYFCKKRRSTIQWNHACDMPNNSYRINNQTGKCYKMHTSPMTWPQAHAACNAEQSYLAIINNHKEAEELSKLVGIAPSYKLRGSFLNDTILLGFHDRLNDGWTTITGQPLEESGYFLWSQQEPDSDEQKKCGAMYFNGLLKGVDCNQKALFICEHDINYA